MACLWARLGGFSRVLRSGLPRLRHAGFTAPPAGEFPPNASGAYVGKAPARNAQRLAEAAPAACARASHAPQADVARRALVQLHALLRNLIQLQLSVPDLGFELFGKSPNLANLA